MAERPGVLRIGDRVVFAGAEHSVVALSGSLVRLVAAGTAWKPKPAWASRSPVTTESACAAATRSMRPAPARLIGAGSNGGGATNWLV